MPQDLLPAHPLAPPPYRFPATLPLVPRILVSGPGAGEIYNPADFWAFTESCVVRGLGAGVAGGLMGLFFGAVFSTYGSLAPHDPALRDWQAAAAARGGALNTGGSAATPLPGALPFPTEPPKVPLLRALKEGLVEVRFFFPPILLHAWRAVLLLRFQPPVPR